MATHEIGMEGLSPVNRPLTLGELAVAFEVPSTRLERLVARHRIDPACRIGATRVYGPKQIAVIFAALGRDAEAEPPCEAAPDHAAAAR